MTVIEYSSSTGMPAWLPTEPLLTYLDRSDIIGFSVHDRFADIYGAPKGINERHAERCGVNLRTVQRWRVGRQRISATSADEVATRLGLHPMLIWPDYSTSEP